MRNRIESFQGSRHFRLHHIADSVVAAVAIPGTGSLANSAIIDLGGTTLVVTVQNQRSIEELAIPEEYRAWYFTTYFKTNLSKVYELITEEG